jgi:hypothetical protein
MKDPILGIIMSVMIASVLNGCGQRSHRSDTDITSSPEYNFKSFAGTVWKTKVKTVLGDIKSYTGEHHITVLPPSAFDSTHPEYRPPPFMEKVIAVLPVGTRVRIERLIEHSGSAYFLYVTVSLEDGGTASLEHGKVLYLDRELLAENRFIGRVRSDSKEWGVNPDMLEKAESK